MISKRSIYCAGVLLFFIVSLTSWIASQTKMDHQAQSPNETASPEERLKNILAETSRTSTFEGRFCVIEVNHVKKTEKRSEKTIGFNGNGADIRRITPPTSPECLAYLESRRLTDGWKVILSEGLEFDGPWETTSPQVEGIGLASFEEGEWVPLVDADGNNVGGQPLPPEDSMTQVVDSLNSIPSFPEDEPIVFSFVGLARPYEDALNYFRSRVVALPGGRLQWELTPKPGSWYAQATIVINEATQEVDSAKIICPGGDVQYDCKVLSMKRSRDGKDGSAVAVVAGQGVQED